MSKYITALFCGIILLTTFKYVVLDDVNEDLCSKVDLDGPVQAIQYKLENLYNGSEKETDLSIVEIKSNFEDLSHKADQISDECDRKTPKLLGFINQMNQAKQCIDALAKRNQLESQNECQSVHDEAKLNFVVRNIANNSDGYGEVLKCAHSFTDLVQRVKIYRAILREWDKGDESTNTKFYDTVKKLINEKNAPSNALKDILKSIAMRSILDKNLKFTNMTLIDDLYDYDYALANSAVDELVTKVYNQNNYTAMHLLYLPSIQSRIMAAIAIYNKSMIHSNHDLAKQIFQVIYLSRLHPDFRKVDVKSKLFITNIMKNLTNEKVDLKNIDVCIYDTLEFDNDIENEINQTEQIYSRAVSKNDNADWKFKQDDNGNVWQIRFSDVPTTLIFVNKKEYPFDYMVSSLFSTNKTLGNWEKIETNEICSLKPEYKNYICSDGRKFINAEAFDKTSIEDRKIIYEAKKTGREATCQAI